jgi:alpha-1,3-mannosyltransferase
MRILHVANQFWPNAGGIEKFVMDLCSKTQSLGVESRVLCLDRTKGNAKPLSKSDEINGIKIRRVPFLDLHYYKPAFLPKEELSWADVIHVHGISALSDYLVLTKHWHKKPIVLSTHGGLFHTKKIAGIKKMYFFGLQKVMLKGVDLVVADSPHDFELFKPVAPRLVLLENGVDTQRFSSLIEKPRVPNRFLFVGRLSKNKGIEKLLETFAKLKKKGVLFELRIVGADWGKIRKELEKEARALGIGKETVFTGEVSERKLFKEYGKARFFVSASEYEGFGISVIEAMTAGCICILNRIESFEHFSENEKNAFLADFENHAQTAERIIEVMRRRNGKIRKNASKRAESYSWEKKAAEWLVVYKNILSKTGKKK